MIASIDIENAKIIKITKSILIDFMFITSKVIITSSAILSTITKFV